MAQISIMANYMQRLYDYADRVLGRHRTVVFFLFSGGTAAVVDLGLLYILVDFFDIWYLLSAAIAFIVAFFVSFTLQKFVTFVEHSRDRIPKQLVQYFSFAIFNLGMNTLLMYIVVEKIMIHYLLAQIIASGIIALYSYFVYKYFIFQKISVKVV